MAAIIFGKLKITTFLSNLFIDFLKKKRVCFLLSFCYFFDMTKRKMTTKNIKASSLLMLFLTLSACTAFNKPNQAKTINNARASILTQNTLSNHTTNVLVSSGVDTASCFANFNLCQEKISHLFLNETTKTRLSVLAELNFAHAKQLKASPLCQGVFSKPPLDKNFPNTYSQKSKTEQEQIKQEEYSCKIAQRQALYNVLRYSYAHLFFDQLTEQQSIANSPFIDEENIKTQDLYLVATSELINELYKHHQGAFFDAIEDKTPSIKLRLSQEPMLKISQISTKDLDKTNTLSLYLANDPYFVSHLNDDNAQNDSDNQTPLLSDLRSIYEQDLSQVGLVSTRTGLGVGYVGALTNRHTNTVKNFTQNRHNTDLSFLENNPTKRIFEISHLALTGLIVPQGDTLEKVLNTHQFDALFFNPYQSSTVKILGKTYPLYANYSASYANWLNENEFDKIALANLLIKNGGQLPELYLLEPYNPNKKVIIMLHGLASSPQTWVKLTNNLLADPVLRDNYQVWQIFYATNLPILENRYQIHQLINATFAKYDPNHQQTDSILMGHSMGGVISRLLVSDANLLDNVDDIQDANHTKNMGDFDSANPPTTHQATVAVQKLRSTLSAQELAVFDSRFVLSPLPQISNAIFISAPHKGTDYADRWFTRGLRKIIELPVGLSRDVKGILNHLTDNESPSRTHLPQANTPAPLLALGDLYLQNGASQLSNQSAFMKLTHKAMPAPTVRYHSIMANNSKTAKNSNEINDLSGEHISDGIVPYHSSRLDGATSETVLSGNHSIHENPQTILQLRKILHEHLKNQK